MYTFKGAITEQDYIDYNLFHTNGLKSFKRTKLGIRFVFPLGFPLFISLTQGEFNVVFWIVLLIGTVFTFFWIPRLMDNTLKKRVVSMLHEGALGELFVEREYTIDENGIKVASENASNQYKWKSVTRIEESENAFYIYISSIQAVIIPKSFFNDYNEMNAFRTDIHSFVG